MGLKNKRILFLITGSVASYKAAEVVSHLVQNGAEVKVVLSPSATRFVGEATFEGLTGHKVFSDIFEKGSMMSHIDLARWADLMILCPATAHTINKLAQGTGDDLIGNLSLAKESSQKLYIFPAMNTKMYEHPSVQTSLATLKSWEGYEVAPVNSGSLACGEVGEGRLLSPDQIIDYMTEQVSSGSSAKKILITAGGTQEAIDGVRCITNHSTGRTGQFLAQQLSQTFDVVYLHGLAAQPVEDASQNMPFSDFQDLNTKMKNFLESTDFDCVIHLAAVSDYSISEIQKNGKTFKPDKNSKLSSKSEVPSAEMVIKLKPNEKIVSSLKDFSKNKNLTVIGFKLTHTSSKSEQLSQVYHLWEHSSCDWIVHNDLNDIQKNQHCFNLFKSPSTHSENKDWLSQSQYCRNKNELSKIILKTIVDSEKANIAAQPTRVVSRINSPENQL